MRALIMCVVAMLFVSCHTSKQTKTDTKIVETSTSVERQETFISLLDSLRISRDIEVSDISYSVPFIVSVNGRDSVVEAKTTVGKINVKENIEKIQKQEIENKIEAETSKETDSKVKTDVTADKVVIAEPVPWAWWVLLGLGVAVVAFILSRKMGYFK